MHRELKRKHVTLQILWDEYIALRPDGYSVRIWLRAYESSGNLWLLTSELKDGSHFWLSKAEGRKQP